MFKKYCKDCNAPTICHFQTWIDEIINTFLPNLRLSKKINSFFDVLLEKFFIITGLIKIEENFLLSKIQIRSACFISEAKKQGIKFKIIKGPFGYTNQFCASIANKNIFFECLPLAEHISKYDISLVDCKEKTKNHLKKGNFPIAKGKFFWFWQKNQAIKYGINNLTFPLVVKPRNGSVSRHVTTNIKNKEILQQAINKAIIYSPVFIVEKFIENSFVHRATVIDFNYVVCVKQIPANVIGDGNSTIQQLINKKNKADCRGNIHQKEFTLYKIIINDTTKKLLFKKKYTLQTIPKKDETIYLQKDPFLKLGGDLDEVTKRVHPDNIQLFKDIAKFFDIRVVGIDFLVPDISRSWKNQFCAVLELNSAPCIEMHHFPSSGAPQNVAKVLVDLFFKYYL